MLALAHSVSHLNSNVRPYAVVKNSFGNKLSSLNNRICTYPYSETQARIFIRPDSILDNSQSSGKPLTNVIRFSYSPDAHQWRNHRGLRPVAEGWPT